MTYFLSFVEEIIMNENYLDHRAGRIEVRDNETDYPYACEEIRFFTDNVEEFYEFQDKWDFEDVGEKTLDKIRKETTRRFNENTDT